MKQPIRIGFIGAGFVANFHARALQSVRGAEVTTILERRGSPELAAKIAANDLGEPRIVPTIADVCAGCDVVAILNPNFARIGTMEQIAEAAARNLLMGVIVDKPLGRNCGEAAAMVRLAQEAGLRTGYFENQIHMPDVTETRRQLTDVAATMGPVHLARTAEEHGGPHEAWFWDPRRQGGGTWSDMGCHSVAVGSYICTPDGEAPDFLVPFSVTSNLALLKWGRDPWRSQLLATHGVDYDKVPAEDYANVTITFRNPKTGQLVVVQATNSWMYDAPGLRLLMEGMAGGYSSGVDTLRSPTEIFISDAAAAQVANSELALEKSQSSRGRLTLLADEPRLYGYEAEWRDALAAFREGRDAMLNFSYGAWVTRLVMAGYYAHEQGETIDPAEMPDNYIPRIQQGRGNEVLSSIA